MTAVVDGLVGRGLVERHHSEDDRRRVSHLLTPSGRQLLAAADEAVEGRLVEHRRLPPHERTARRAVDDLALWQEAMLAHRDRAGADAGEDGRHAGEAPQVPPFVPMGVASRYRAPRATIDPDRSKTWLRRAMPIMKAHKGIFITSLVLSFVGLILQVQIPDLLNKAITNSIVKHVVPLEHYVWWVVALGLAGAVSGYVSRLFLFKTAYAIEFDLRNILYEHFTKMSFPFYDRVQSGQLISRANSDIRSVQMYMTFAPMILVQCSIAVVAFAYMLSINVAAGLRGHGHHAARLPDRRADAEVDVPHLVADPGPPGRRGHHRRRERERGAGGEVLRRRGHRAAGPGQVGRPGPVGLREGRRPAGPGGRRPCRTSPSWAWPWSCCSAGYMVINGKLGIGAILAFNAYLLMLQAPFTMLGMIVMMGQRAAASADRIYEILDERSTIVDRPGAVDLVDCRGDVAFDVGRLRLRRRRAARAFGPRPPSSARRDGCPGGPDRVGKSTVSRLLARFYDVRAGAVRVDGHDVRDLTLESLRSHIGIVLDEPFLFSGVHPRQHRLRRPDGRLRRRRGGSGGGRGRRVHPGAARRLRHGRR